MITPADIPISARQGSYYSGSVSFDPMITDLTDPDTIIRMQWRQSARASSAVLTASTDNGYITVAGTASFTVYIPATVTAAIGTPGADWSGVYDLEIVPAGNEAAAYAVFSGAVTVAGEVTRA